MKNRAMSALLLLLGLTACSCFTWQPFGQRQLFSPSRKTQGSFTPAGRMDTMMRQHPIKILIDDSQLKSYLRRNPGEAGRAQFMLGVILDVKRYFEKTLTVAGDGVVNFAGTKVKGFDNYPYPVGPYTNASADLVIKLLFQKIDGGTNAAACTVNFSSFNDRPNVGALHLDTTKAKQTTADFHQEIFTTVVHEITHILAFSFNSYSRFRRRHMGMQTNQRLRQNEVVTKANIGSVQRLILVTPGLVKYARFFFSCQALPGVPLENNGSPGSAGSHFDMRFFPTEMMSPVSNPPNIMSKFTLQFLKDSGWYDVNFEMEAEYEVGRSAGCNFFTSSTQVKNRGFCFDRGNRGCSADYKIESFCTATDFTENQKIFAHNRMRYCPSPIVHSKLMLRSVETKGPGSRCWEAKPKGGRQASPLCLNSRCDRGRPVFMVGGKDYPCKREGYTFELDFEILEGGRHSRGRGSTTVTCPNFFDFCGALDRSCPRDCGGNKGYCLKNKNCFVYDLSRTTSSNNRNPNQGIFDEPMEGVFQSPRENDFVSPSQPRTRRNRNFGRW